MRDTFSSWMGGQFFSIFLKGAVIMLTVGFLHVGCSGLFLLISLPVLALAMGY